MLTKTFDNILTDNIIHVGNMFDERSPDSSRKMSHLENPFCTYLNSYFTISQNYHLNFQSHNGKVNLDLTPTARISE